MLRWLLYKSIEPLSIMFKYLLLILSLLLNHYSIASDLDNTSTKIVDTFESLFGVTKGKRRNHTKGFCFSANFSPVTSKIEVYSNSALFQFPSNVTGRFSHSGGSDFAADNIPAEYGMGLSFYFAAGSNAVLSNSQLASFRHLMALNTLDFFPVSNPQSFAQFLQARLEGSTALENFKQANSEFLRFSLHQDKQPKLLQPYEGHIYNSINSFYLVNDAGFKTPVRFKFVPTSNRKVVVPPKNQFFYENIKRNLDKGAVSWDLLFVVANKDDAINDSSILWEGKHKTINAGQLTITSVNTESEGQCGSINFDPLVLSKGVEPSNDPMLLTRKKAYAISQKRRLTDKK